jgi:phage FluMu protein Com
MIMELTLTLEFCCYNCKTAVSATVHCSGKGLSGDQAQSIAQVGIPCPDCHDINQVYFKPTGEVHTVQPLPMLRRLLEPSVN